MADIKHIILIYVWLVFWCWDDYSWNLAANGPNNIPNESSGDGNPKMSAGFCKNSNTWFGTEVLQTRRGTMILDGGAMSLNDTTFNSDAPKTAWFVIYIFTVAQQSTIFSIFSSITWNTYFQLRLNNGKMKISVNGFNILTFNEIPKDDVETSSSNTYGTGWNLFCYVEDSSFVIYNYPRFSTTPVSETLTRHSYYEYIEPWLGAKINGNNENFIYNVQGIIHSAWIRDGTLSSTQILSYFMPPMTTPATLWDYFISKFPDLGEQTSDTFFKNTFYGLDGTAQTFNNSLNSTVNATDGLQITSGQVQTIENVEVGDELGIAVQLWFKGTTIDNQNWVAINHGSNLYAYIYRSGNNLVLASTYTASTITISNAISNLDSTGWIFI